MQHKSQVNIEKAIEKAIDKATSIDKAIDKPTRRKGTDGQALDTGSDSSMTQRPSTSRSSSSHIITREANPWDGFGVASHIEISAPPSKVWSTIIDIDSSSLVLSTVESTERIDGSKVDDPVRVGTRWKQTRRAESFGGEKCKRRHVHDHAHTSTITVTCTGMDGETYPKTFSVTKAVPGTAATGSLSVQCIDDDCSRCRLVVSFALVPQSFLSRLLFTSPVGRYFIDKSSIKHVEDDMRDIARYCESTM